VTGGLQGHRHGDAKALAGRRLQCAPWRARHEGDLDKVAGEIRRQHGRPKPRVMRRSQQQRHREGARRGHGASSISWYNSAGAIPRGHLARDSTRSAGRKSWDLKCSSAPSNLTREVYNRNAKRGARSSITCGPGRRAARTPTTSPELCERRAHQCSPRSLGGDSHPLMEFASVAVNPGPVETESTSPIPRRLAKD